MYVFLCYIIYLLFGFFVGVTFDAQWDSAGYWAPYILAGYCIHTSACYFSKKTMYFPRKIPLDDNRYDFSRVLLGYGCPFLALLLLGGWYRHNFGVLLGI